MEILVMPASTALLTQTSAMGTTPPKGNMGLGR